MAIIPVAKAMYLCDYQVGYENGKVDLYGLFNSIRPQRGFPYASGRFCVFVQLTGGLGRIPCFVDIRSDETQELIRTTEVRHLHFPDRFALVQLAMSIEGCRFERPGLYNVQLFCDNTWVCDTQLRLRS